MSTIAHISRITTPTTRWQHDPARCLATLVLLPIQMTHTVTPTTQNTVASPYQLVIHTRLLKTPVV